jgi:hypothetical protein
VRPSRAGRSNASFRDVTSEELTEFEDEEEIYEYDDDEIVDDRDSVSRKRMRPDMADHKSPRIKTSMYGLPTPPSAPQPPRNEYGDYQVLDAPVRSLLLAEEQVFGERAVAAIHHIERKIDLLASSIFRRFNLLEMRLAAIENELNELGRNEKRNE